MRTFSQMCWAQISVHRSIGMISLFQSINLLLSLIQSKNLLSSLSFNQPIAYHLSLFQSTNRLSSISFNQPIAYHLSLSINQSLIISMYPFHGNRSACSVSKWVFFSSGRFRFPKRNRPPDENIIRNRIS